jgi:hypothetical protein
LRDRAATARTSFVVLSSGEAVRSLRWVVEATIPEQGDEADDEAVGHSTEGAMIAESSSAHGPEEVFGPGVVDDGGASHVEEGIAETWLAGAAHGDGEGSP